MNDCLINTPPTRTPSSCDSTPCVMPYTIPSWSLVTVGESGHELPNPPPPSRYTWKGVAVWQNAWVRGFGDEVVSDVGREGTPPHRLTLRQFSNDGGETIFRLEGASTATRRGLVSISYILHACIQYTVWLVVCNCRNGSNRNLQPP